MRKVRAVDVANDTLTVEAGVTLADVQAEAERVDRLFPLSLASEGSCRTAATSPPMPGAPKCCAMATCARSPWARSGAA